MPRQSCKLLSLLSVLAFSVLLHAAPVHLRTNALEQPLGIGGEPPRFSWQSNDAKPGWKQTAYQVLVAGSEQALRVGKADAWDSGRVSSSESVNIVYKGVPLQSSRQYFWQVRTWGGDGESTSPIASFETGLLAAADWKAEWIMRRDPVEADEMQRIRWVWLPGSDAKQGPPSTPAHFRYNFKLGSVPFAASLHVMARGKFVARINGHETGHHNEWSAFDREEALPYLRTGENTIEIDLTSPKIEKEPGAPAALAASLRLRDEKGGYRALVTGGTWQARSNDVETWKAAQVVGPISEPFGLGVDRKSPMPGPDRIATSVSRFRTTFAMKAQVQSARLTVTALGAYKAYVNGKPVAKDALLTPGFTDFKRRVLYQTYDVTGMLQQGNNVLGVLLGGGWYSSPMTWAGVRYTPGPNLLRAQLDVTLADGTHQTVATGPAWQTASSATDFAEIYGGESHDARLADASWTNPGAAPAGWTTAAVSQVPSGVEVTAEPDLPIHQTQTLQPVHLDPANAAHGAIFDMGQNMVGNVRLHVRGSRGASVRLRYAERLNPDGSIYTENLRNADATDTYTLRGDGEETWTPSFTFHGFRYVEVTTLTPRQTVAIASMQSVEGLVYNSLPVKPSVRLASSSDVLNKMNELGWWGQRGNFVSIPTDCPQRDERLGWMGDAGVFWRTGTFNFNIDAFSHKFLLDVIDAQTPEGAFTDIAPDILKWGPGAPGWGDAGVFVPYATWLQYGDIAIVQQAWPAMERWMDFIANDNPNYLRQKQLGNNYADWLAPDEKTPKDLIATAYWALIAREMAEMATALHREADALKYRDLHAKIAAAYRTAWVKPDGAVEGDTQTSYAATLATGIATDAQRSALVDRLVKKIADKGNHLSTGFLGTPFLLPVLDETGHSDLAFKLLLTETYPSWGYMVKKGATTWWERWNGDTGDPGMNSYNHYAFGSVMAWVYRRAAGIDTDASGAGFHHLTVQPHFDSLLPQLHVEYDSTYGTVISDWQQRTHTFTLTLPANTTATVVLPGKKAEEAGSGEHVYNVP